MLAGDPAGLGSPTIGDRGQQLLVLGGDLRRSGRGGQRLQGRDQDLIPEPVQGREGDRVAGQLGDPAVKAAVVLDRLLEPTGRRGLGGIGGGGT